MATECIKEELKNNPFEIIKGCAGVLGSLDDGFTENIYSEQAIKIIADLMTDAVSRIEDQQKEKRR